MVLVSLLCPLFPRVSVDGGSTAHPIHLLPSYRVIGACSAAFQAV